MRIWLTFFAFLLAYSARAATLASDGSQSDVQAKINSAVDDDIVTIPSGSFTWTTTITITGKGITLKGAGGGWAKGYSITSVTIGTGLKTFTVQTGLGYVVGEAITARRKYNGDVNYMTGTVNSYSGSTLVINVTSVGGSGTLAYWNFEQQGATKVSFGGITGLNVTKDSTHKCTIRDIHFTKTGTTTGSTGSIVFDGSGKAIIMRDCRFTITTGSNAGKGIKFVCPDMGIVVSKVDCDNNFAWPTSGGNIALYTSQFFSMPTSTQATWDDTSYAGDLDTTGLKHIYIEDSHWFGANQEAADVDGGNMVVFRYNVFDNCGLTSHGPDTGPYGLRWVEFYNNEWVYDDMGSAGAAPMNYTFFMRGGTGLFADNIIPNVTSSTWGNKAELKFMIEYLRRDAGDFGCGGSGWGFTYPGPRQVGFGRVTGSGPTYGNGYGGDLEPIYLWGNSGGGNYDTPSLENYCDGVGCNAPACTTCCAGAASGPDINTYVQSGREYYPSTTKPSYTKFQYPHPLIDSSVADPGLSSGIGLRARMLKLKAR